MSYEISLFASDLLRSFGLIALSLVMGGIFWAALGVRRADIPEGIKNRILDLADAGRAAHVVDREVERRDRGGSPVRTLAPRSVLALGAPVKDQAGRPVAYPLGPGEGGGWVRAGDVRIARQTAPVVAEGRDDVWYRLLFCGSKHLVLIVVNRGHTIGYYTRNRFAWHTPAREVALRFPVPKGFRGAKVEEVRNGKFYPIDSSARWGKLELVLDEVAAGPDPKKLAGDDQPETDPEPGLVRFGVGEGDQNDDEGVNTDQPVRQLANARKFHERSRFIAYPPAPRNGSHATAVSVLTRESIRTPPKDGTQRDTVYLSAVYRL